MLTGCSGVGKTTTAQELLQRETNYIVMDADILYNIMPHETEEDLLDWVEHIMEFSLTIM
ncbi:AAA family ATPase [Lachnoclostridium phytofermentans]|uniref:AAA family ATPase n=1 Tax=Lachnoclostridium phytofermentans TaxID=66219 RepID=UPI0012DC736F